MPLTDSPYRWLLLAGVAVSFFLWSRLARREPRLLGVYLGGLLGAFTGAKLVYLGAEGWLFWDSPQRWLIWATGKTILGALLGGYAGVEIAKKLVGYERATGDLFAIVAPVGIILGRIGCLLHGCCAGRECAPAWWTIRDHLGVTRWPAVPAEIGFNVLALAVFLAMRWWNARSERVCPPAHKLNALGARVPPFAGQHFHLYLIGYGTFRFLHEILRDTPRLAPGISGYQVAALACVLLGAWGFFRRRKLSHTHP